jgi:hypothetical protein
MVKNCSLVIDLDNAIALESFIRGPVAKAGFCVAFLPVRPHERNVYKAGIEMVYFRKFLLFNDFIVKNLYLFLYNHFAILLIHFCLYFWNK